MIFSPASIPNLPMVDDALFPEKLANEPDESPGEDVNSARRLAARAAIERLQLASSNAVKEGAHQGEVTVRTEFSDKHAVFGVHMAVRTTDAPAGSVVVGAVHKYPTLNILMKGRVVMVSEHGRRVLVAPCMYMQAPNTKKAGWVLEDCSLSNVVLVPDAPESAGEAEAIVRSFHTAENYAGLGIPVAQQDTTKKIEG